MKKILLTILCTLLSTMSWAQGTTAGDESYNEAYAVLVFDENNTASLTMYYDANRDAHREGQVIGLDEMMQNQAWMMYRENVTTVVFDSSFAECRPTSTAFWFAYCRSLTSIVGLQYLRTDETTNMSFMFNECSSLTSLDLSSLNTENVTNISGMLGGCRSLTSVDLSGFNTRQVTNMNSLFEQSAALTTINLSSFNTSQVTDMSYMFNECSALTTIYVGSDWSTEAVTNGTDMFNKCTNLVGGAGTTFSADHIDHTYARIDAEGTPGYLTDSKNASMTHFVMITVEGNGEVSAGQAAVIRDRGDVHVANGEPLEMFFFPDEGYQLASVKIDSLDVTSQVTPATEYSAASYTIPGVYGDIAITVTFAQTSTDAEAYAVLSDNNTVLTFYYDDQKDARGGMSVEPTSGGNGYYYSWWSNRETITAVIFDASFANYTSLTITANWFDGMGALTTIEGISNLKTDNVTDMGGMFLGCSGLTSLDLRSFNTSNVTNMGSMFDGCSSLTSLDVSGFNTASVKEMSRMFNSCSSLTTLDVTNFNTANVTSMFYMFKFCSGLTTLDLSNFNTANVTAMFEMFASCSELKTIFAGYEWATNSETDGGLMFYDCPNLVGGAGTVYSADHTDHTYAHIDGGTENPGYFTRSGEAPSGNAEPYAVLSDNNTLLTFYYDNQKTARGGMSVGPFEKSSNVGWYSVRRNIQTVVFDASFADCTSITSTTFWFNGFNSLDKIEGMENLKTDNVTNMSGMFAGCRVTNIDFSKLNTSNVTDMSMMFCEINGDLSASLDLSSFNTSKVTDMTEMFVESSGLSSINLSGFDTSNVTAMEDMFAECSALTSLDLSSFNTSNVANMGGLFRRCTALTTIYAGNEWSTDKVTDGSRMFDGCTNLVGGAGTAYSADHTDHTYAHIDGGAEYPGYFTRSGEAPSGNAEPYAVLSADNTILTFYYDSQKSARNGLSVGPFGSATERAWSSNRGAITTVIFDESFANCTSLTSTAYWFYDMGVTAIEGISNLKTDNVTNMSGMFYACGSLTNLDVSGFKTDNVTDMNNMFSFCWRLTSLDLSNFNTSNVTDMNNMFNGCSGLTALDVSGFKTDNVTNMSHMFSECYGLTSLDVSGFKTDKVTDMRSMFDGCYRLTSLDVSGFKTDNVTNMSYMFSGCYGLTSLDVSGFKTDNVTSMDMMFINCFGLTSLDLSNFNTSSVTGMDKMFNSCSGLTSLDLSSFNTASVTNMNGMFEGCSGLTTIYAGDGWNITAATTGAGMFFGCTNLVGGAGTVYSADHVDYTYAHIDGGTANPGYFTDKNATPLEKVATPTFSWRNDELTMSCSTEGATIMYQMSDEDTNGDGVINDDDYKQYSAPIEVKRDVIIKAIATKEGMATSDTITLDYPYEAWTRLYETCIIGQEILSRASRSSRVPQEMVDRGEAYIAYALDMYAKRTEDRDRVESVTQEIRVFLAEIEQMMQVPATYSNYVLTAEEDATMAEIADQYGSYYGNQVAAIVWNSSVPMTESDLQRFTSNPNLLIYAQSESMVPANRNNVVINGVAKNVVLTTTATGNCNFYAPQEFTAEAIQYTRTFSQQTQIGVSRGWEAIALPFTVQTYTHADRGVIAPFGNSASENHFWLRELTQNGLQNAQTIEANKPYIISMPNSEEYRPETNLAGQVTFSALNAIVPVTEATPVEYGSISLVPAFQSRSAQTEIYALNVGEERNGYPEGSVFERDYRTVRPFEAYTLHRDNQNPAPQFIMIGGDMGNGTTGIEELVDKRMNTNDSWYTIDGRRLQGAPAGKGLYIRNGKKVIVR
ncbi:MAG: BspA family leucine-rich repeat surface protein [Prevotella sp.]|nr:BspA family leucine-rich repeat surface protein [Prevotella sp.]